MRKAAKEEIQENKQKNPTAKENDLTVSSDGSWQTRGFSSLFRIVPLIGTFKGKVIDVSVKSSYYQGCTFLKSMDKNSAEYEEEYETHKATCKKNHERSAGKMEVDSVIIMFLRSLQNLEVRFMNYIGDGDSKTYSGIVKAAPYGDDVVTKKECVGHVQKRMGTRLQKLKKENKGLGGKGKLTAKWIDKL